LRAALPTLAFLAALGRFSMIPADWLAAIPIAFEIWSAGSASSFAHAAAAPKTPQVEVWAN